MSNSNLLEKIQEINFPNENKSYYVSRLNEIISEWGSLQKIESHKNLYTLNFNRTMNIELKIQQYETDLGKGLTISNKELGVYIMPYHLLLVEPIKENESLKKHFYVCSKK